MFSSKAPSGTNFVLRRNPTSFPQRKDIIQLQNEWTLGSHRYGMLIFPGRGVSSMSRYSKWGLLHCYSWWSQYYYEPRCISCPLLRILYNDPLQMYLGLARAHFLSPTGQCKSFDAAADGYCRAEGCGVFVLKRLSDAIAENDRIHGVIKGVETNQSGCAHSITHPHPETQAALFQRLLTRTKTDPNTVSVVEAHGTGTQVRFLPFFPVPI